LKGGFWTYTLATFPVTGLVAESTILRANWDKPLLLVDIDGVISIYGFETSERPPGSFLVADGIPHYISANASVALQELAENFELVWCTGWEEKANEYLPHALGLPAALPYLTFAVATQPGVNTAGHWKLGAIDEFAGNSRALAWIDDDHRDCETWAAGRSAPTLLVTTEPSVGVTEEHVEQLQAWAAGLPNGV
jgi:hypothetical protein